MSAPSTEITHHPSWYPVPGIHNLRRALPSYPLYRSAAPMVTFTAEHHPLLLSTGVTHIYDFRAPIEISRMVAYMPVLDYIPGLTRVPTPVYSDKSYAPGAVGKHWRQTLQGDLVSGYMDMLAEGREGAYEKVFRHVLNENGGLLVHCALGKDRTGVIVAVLLKLAGCTDEQVIEDYSLTEEGLAEVAVGVKFRQMLETGIEAMEVVQKIEDQEKRTEGVKHVLSARRETMRDFLERLESEEGGAEGYIMSCGFTKEEVEKMKMNLKGGSDGGL